MQTNFKIPAAPKPRLRYFVRTQSRPNKPGTWDSTIVEVFDRGVGDGESRKVYEYVRSYSMLQTFEPFRQGDRNFALISPNYTATAVLDLDEGKIIAEEKPDSFGFCPVGFYVPDWLDVYDAGIKPDSEYWSEDFEWPIGDFGFIWGCVWGDDTSWKVQYLDLSQIQNGILKRDERFGYVALATIGYRSPALREPSYFEHSGDPDSPPFIEVSKYGGQAQVKFAVEKSFDLASGKAFE